MKGDYNNYTKEQLDNMFAALNHFDVTNTYSDETSALVSLIQFDFQLSVDGYAGNDTLNVIEKWIYDDNDERG